MRKSIFAVALPRCGRRWSHVSWVSDNLELARAGADSRCVAQNSIRFRFYGETLNCASGRVRDRFVLFDDLHRRPRQDSVVDCPSEKL